ncbi:MAG: hypothetical protein RLZZ214_1912, partial [Verrucomicrobiota bacterium]
AKAALEAQLRAAADDRAAAAAKARVEDAVEIQAAHEAKFAAAMEAAAELQAKAVEEAKLRAAEEAMAKAKDRVQEDVQAMVGIKAQAAEEARAAAAQERASIEAKATEDARSAAAAKRKIRHEKRVRAADKAKTRTLARAAAAVQPPKPKPAKKNAKSVWFYTCEGERLGPVTFEELRAMAIKSSLDPRLDMVWKQTMDAWKPAGQIDGLFERMSVPLQPQNDLARPVAPVVAPRRSTRPPPTGGESWPGVRRRSLFLVTLVFPILWEYALAAGSPFLVKRLGGVMMGEILPYAPLVPFAVVLFFWLKRLANLGMSGMWSLALLVPGLNLWVAYRCFVCPPGYADHKTLDRPGVVLAVVFWLIILAVASILAAIAALRFDWVDDPALREQLRGWVQAAMQG